VKRFVTQLVRVSPALVVAMLALLVALGGVSTAAQISGPQASESTAAQAAKQQARRGPRGKRGPRGRRGPRGLRGLPGPEGEEGEEGDEGEKGDDGDEGPKGDKGDKGDTGPPAATAYARVAADGMLLSDRGVEIAQAEANTAGGPVYWVGFNEDVRACAINITVINPAQVSDFTQIPDGSAAAAFVTDDNFPNTVPNVHSAIVLRIRDAVGAVTQRPFQVTVLC
jgi:hypothetical protein